MMTLGASVGFDRNSGIIDSRGACRIEYFKGNLGVVWLKYHSALTQSTTVWLNIFTVWLSVDQPIAS